MTNPDRKNIAAWVALAISSFFACLWAFWGIIENFHEGWYYPSFGMNVALMFAQYLLFAVIFWVLNVIAVHRNRVGAVLFVAIGILIPAVKIHTSAAIYIFSIPLFIIGIMYWFGEFKNRKWPLRIAGWLPLLIIIAFGTEPAVRVSGRMDDKNYGSRRVEGNGVALVWAPEGPGWPSTPREMTGKRWKEVSDICAHLSEDGTVLLDSAQNIWRLPTVEEAVRSLTRHGQNAGGQWDAIKAKATYSVMPDKETPLWKVHSPIIYWWTSSEVNDSTVYRVVYNGGVQSLSKKTSMGSLGFRAVKEAH